MVFRSETVRGGIEVLTILSSWAVTIKKRRTLRAVVLKSDVIVGTVKFSLRWWLLLVVVLDEAVCSFVRRFHGA
jgi:hypothetical protein